MAPYFVALFAMLLSATCALTLFSCIRHFDSAEPPAAHSRKDEPVAGAAGV